MDYTKMMSELIEIRTLVIELMQEAMRDNNQEAYRRQELNLQQVEEMMEETRNTFMQW